MEKYIWSRDAHTLQTCAQVYPAWNKKKTGYQITFNHQVWSPGSTYRMVSTEKETK